MKWRRFSMVTRPAQIWGLWIVTPRCLCEVTTWTGSSSITTAVLAHTVVAVWPTGRRTVLPGQNWPRQEWAQWDAFITLSWSLSRSVALRFRGLPWSPMSVGQFVPKSHQRTIFSRSGDLDKLIKPSCSAWLGESVQYGSSLDFSRVFFFHGNESLQIFFVMFHFHLQNIGNHRWFSPCWKRTCHVFEVDQDSPLCRLWSACCEVNKLTISNRRVSHGLGWPANAILFLTIVKGNQLRPAGGDPGLDHLQKYFFDSLCFLEWTWPFWNPWKTFHEKNVWLKQRKTRRKVVPSLTPFGAARAAVQLLTTVITQIFVRDLISYISYIWRKVRNLVAYENHTRMHVYLTPPSLYENF